MSLAISTPNYVIDVGSDLGIELQEKEFLIQPQSSNIPPNVQANAVAVNAIAAVVQNGNGLDKVKHVITAVHTISTLGGGVLGGCVTGLNHVGDFGIFVAVIGGLVTGAVCVAGGTKLLEKYNVLPAGSFKAVYSH